MKHLRLQVRQPDRVEAVYLVGQGPEVPAVAVRDEQLRAHARRGVLGVHAVPHVYKGGVGAARYRGRL